MSKLVDKFKETIYIKDQFPYPNDNNEVKYEARMYTSEVSEIKVDVEVDKDYIPQEKDRLFFYPGCDVPRLKVREWAKNKNISVTIKEENATASFISNKTLNSFLKSSYQGQMKKDEFLTWFNKSYSEIDPRFVDFIKAVKESENDVIKFDRHSFASDMGFRKPYYNNQLNIHPDIKDCLYNYPSLEHFCYHRHINIRDWTHLNSLINSSIVYDQEKLVSLISDDAVVIDAEMYNTLRGMFQGTREDQVVALEIIANCNYDPSLHHILLLIKEFYGIISGLKESKHINFKSLVEYLSIDISYINEDAMVECLMSKKVLTMDILKELSNGVKIQWGNSYNTKYFLVNSITVSDEIKDYFNKQKEEVLEKEEQEV